MIKNSYDIVSFFTFDKRILELYDRWEILWTLEILQAFYSFKGAGIHKISADYIYTLMFASHREWFCISRNNYPLRKNRNVSQ